MAKTKLIPIIMPVNGKYKNQTFTSIFDNQDDLGVWLSELWKKLGKNTRITGYIVAGKIIKVWM